MTRFILSVTFALTILTVTNSWSLIAVAVRAPQQLVSVLNDAQRVIRGN